MNAYEISRRESAVRKQVRPLLAKLVELTGLPKPDLCVDLGVHKLRLNSRCGGKYLRPGVHTWDRRPVNFKNGLIVILHDLSVPQVNLTLVHEFQHHKDLADGIDCGHHVHHDKAFYVRLDELVARVQAAFGGDLAVAPNRRVMD